MLELILFFFIISSGSVLCSAVFHKRYEEVLPITCSGVVFVLFMFGLFNGLKIGPVIVCVCSLLCYIVALIWVFMHKNVKEWLRNTFTLGFLSFLILSMVCTFASYGKLMHSWDEFSHWGDSVKAMVTIDDFGTNAAAKTLFKSYPPGMSLFQYMLQKLHLYITGNIFSEWLLYVAYQIFAFSFLVPFFNGKGRRNIFPTLVSTGIIFLAPLIFYEEIYTTLYIDPFLGILSGAGVAMILWDKNKDIFYTLRILMICSMLVMAKDAGMLYAAIIGITYVVDIIIEQKRCNAKVIRNALFAILAVIVPKLLWNFDIWINSAQKRFSAPVDFEQLINVVIGIDETYKSVVWSNFWRYLVIVPVKIASTGLSLNYLSLLLVFLLTICILIRYAIKQVGMHKSKGTLIFTIIVVQAIVYIIGLAVTYMFKFTEYEAMQLASYTRYMNILYLAMLMIIVLSTIQMMYNIVDENRYFCAFAMCTFMVMISPMTVAFNYVTREAVATSQSIRGAYQSVVDKVEHQIEDDDNIYLIVQASSGYEKLVLTYLLRNYSVNTQGYSIGEPFFEGDIYTVEKTPEEWIDELCEEYDYVLLYNINDYFIENYGNLFDTTEIVSNGLYKVNKTTRKLEFIE